MKLIQKMPHFGKWEGATPKDIVGEPINMSFFKSCPLPADLCGLVMDFVHTVDPRSYQKCIYESQHHIWYATMLCGAWCGDMRPSDYKTLVTTRDHYDINSAPLGFYTQIPYWELFAGTHI